MTSAALAGAPSAVATPPGSAPLSLGRQLPAQGLGTGLTALYFTNGTLAGAPVVKRVDPLIDFHWTKAAPAPEVPAESFSVRWEGLLAAPTTGRYRFSVLTAGEVRLWVNGKKVLDNWDGKKASAIADPTVNLAAGEKTSIKLEYHKTEGDNGIQLLWVAPGQAAQLLPTANLYPLGSPLTPDPAGAVAATPAPAAKPAEGAPAKAAKAEKAAAKAEKLKTEKAKAAPAAVAEAAPAAPAPAAVAASAPVKPAATSPAGPVTAVPEGALAGGVFMFTNRATGKPLEVDMGRPATRAEQLAMVNSNAAAQWRVESVADGFYRLAVPGNNKVLEVLGSSTSNGAMLSLWPYYSGYNQLWKIEEVGDGYYKLTAKHSRKALTEKDSLDGGFQQWRYSGKETQQWKLTAVKPTEAKPTAAVKMMRGVGAYNMSVGPNPSTGVAQLMYELKEEKPLGWVLYNQRGVAVRVSDYRKQAAGSHLQTLDFTDLPAGDYYLHLTVGAETTRQLISLRRPTSEAPAVGATK